MSAPATTGIDGMTCLGAAWEYAKRGFQVIPLQGIRNGKCTCQEWRDKNGKGTCGTPGKHPRFRNWPERATTDAIEIEKWFCHDFKGSNVGIATGTASGIFVLDVDPKNGGDDSLDSLIAKHGSLPDTLQAMTGSGGRHYYFKHPGGTVPNEVSILPGLDIRGDGGQVVAAPSMHMSGRNYEWDGLDGFNAPILPAPEWLLALMCAKEPKRTRGGKVVPIGKAVPEGQRNATLTRLAGVARRKGSSVAAINAYLQAENAERCKPPLPEDEVRQIAESVCRYAPEQNAPADSDRAAAVSWRDNLIVNREGNPKPILANAITALRLAPEWAGILGFNEFSLGTVALKPVPWDGAVTGAEWTDHEDRLTANWLQHQGIFVSVEIAGQAIQSVAKDRRFHPVREYLDSLTWDGTKRIDTWLSLYLGAETNDYTAAVGARWLISAVARIYQPGAKADCCLILEGPQGLKKSTALKTIAGEWFTDEMADLGSKDAAMQTRGVWIIEIAELDSMSRSDVGRIKAFMSRSTDRFRPPYGKRLIESPRQCTFSGSVNHSSYLRDETGGRRFWPVACTRILIDELARDRGQLWAEAVARYRGGSPWWLDSVQLNRLAEREQSDRYEGDPWDELIAAWVEHPSQQYDGSGHPLMPFSSDAESVSITDVLTHCIGKRQDQWTQADKNRVGRCLRALGWERYRGRTGNSLEWRFRRAAR